MSICDTCKKRTYCKTKCRQHREEAERRQRALYYQIMDKLGRLAPSVKALHSELFMGGNNDLLPPPAGGTSLQREAGDTSSAAAAVPSPQGEGFEGGCLMNGEV